jgi:hypothetical protein
MIPRRSFLDSTIVVAPVSHPRPHDHNHRITDLVEARVLWGWREVGDGGGVGAALGDGGRGRRWDIRKQHLQQTREQGSRPEDDGGCAEQEPREEGGDDDDDDVDDVHHDEDDDVHHHQEEEEEEEEEDDDDDDDDDDDRCRRRPQRTLRHAASQREGEG